MKMSILAISCVLCLLPVGCGDQAGPLSAKIQLQGADDITVRAYEGDRDEFNSELQRVPVTKTDLMAAQRWLELVEPYRGRKTNAISFYYWHKPDAQGQINLGVGEVGLNEATGTAIAVKQFAISPAENLNGVTWNGVVMIDEASASGPKRQMGRMEEHDVLSLLFRRIAAATAIGQWEMG